MIAFEKYSEVSKSDLQVPRDRSVHTACIAEKEDKFLSVSNAIILQGIFY